MCLVFRRLVIPVIFFGVFSCFGCQPVPDIQGEIVPEETDTSSPPTAAQTTDTDGSIEVPATAPPLITSIGDWRTIALSEEMIPAMSGPVEEEIPHYFTKAHQGFLYSTANQEKGAKPSPMQQPYFPLNNLHRIVETGQQSFSDPESIYIRPENDGWRIDYFAVSDHYIWWCEINERTEPYGWKLYEMRLEDGSPSVIAEDSNVEGIHSKAPSRMSTDQDLLVYQAYDTKTSEDVIYLRSPEHDTTRILAKDSRSEENSYYFYDPKISNPYIVWAKSQIIDEERELGQVFLYNLETDKLLSVNSGDRSFTEPVVAGHHLVVRYKPEGKNYIEKGDVYQGAEIWHYNLNEKVWDFRITNNGSLYSIKGPMSDPHAFTPITLLSLDACGRYLTWRTEPATERPYVVDMETQTAYPVPISEEKGTRILAMTLVPEGFYWKTAEDNASLYKARLVP